MDRLTLSMNLVNGILGYLGKRPYEETYQLIAAIQEEAKNQPKDEPIEVAVE
jgi:hypothetical protein